MNPNEAAQKAAPELASSGTSLLEETSFREAWRGAIVRPVAALVFALLLLLGLLSYLFFTTGRADHSNAVLAQISRVEKLAVDMETGVRGYRITGDTALLEPFQRANAVFASELDALEKLVRDNSFQLNELGALRKSHAVWSEFATNVRERVQAQLPADIAAHVRGKELMDAVRARIDTMQHHERTLLAERAATRGQLRAITFCAVILSGLVLTPMMTRSVRRSFLGVNTTYRGALTAVDAERERLRVTLSSIGDAVIATDANGLVTYLNPVAEELTGWRSAEANGQPLTIIFRVINEQSRKTVDSPVENVLREGRIVGLANHTLLIARDARETPIADSAAPIRDAAGQITGVVLVFRDQTAERQVAAKAEWLASFPENNPNPVIELAADTGEIVYTNSFSERAFPDLKAKGLRHEFFTGLKEAARPLIEGQSKFIRREMAAGENCYAQTICYLPDTKRLRIYCSDITETKDIEKALRHSRDQIQLISDGLPALISYVDKEKRYQFCNHAYLEWFGLTEEKIVGRHMRDVVGDEAWKTIGPHVEEALAGQNVEYEAHANYPTGARWIHAIYKPHRDEHGDVVGIVVMVTDVSASKRAEMLLDSQKRSLEMVVSGAPITDVLTFLARVVEQQSGGKAIASLLLLDSAGLLRNGASPSLPADYLKAIDGLKPCAEIGTCSVAAATGHVVLTPDISADPKWQTLKHLPLNLGYVAAWSQPITASDGRVLGTFGTYFRECREPTPFERQAVEILARTAALAIERRRVEDDRNRFVSLAENSSDFIGMCGPDLLPFFVNRAGLAMMGLDDLEHARRTPVKEFFFPEDQVRVMNQFFPMVLAQGSGQIEVRFRHFKTGEALWMLYNVWVVNDDQDKFAGLATVSRDITQRKLAEEALRASEERYRSLFESIDEGFCVIEMIFDEDRKAIDYRFIEVNPAFERQAGMRNATGKRMLEFVSEIEPHWLENYGRVALTGEPIRFADEYKSLGSWFDVYAFRVGEPQSHRVAVIFNNITKRKQAEEAVLQSQTDLSAANAELALRARELDEMVERRTAELRETIQQLETFSYSIVHDMRAPLRSMRSFAGFLEQDHASKLDPKARDYLRRIMDSAARMDALITDVLSYSRVSRGATDLSSVDLDRLVPEIIEQYPQLQEKSESIQMVRPLPKVSGNIALLTQVFSNLLGNALKFVPDKCEPQVRIRWESNCDYVRIWVEDNGIGVPADQHERIFGLFQRLHRPDQYAGTGVGLAIVKRAVEKMGGRTGVESELGRGSRFWLDLRLPEATKTNHVTFERNWRLPQKSVEMS